MCSVYYIKKLIINGLIGVSVDTPLRYNIFSMTTFYLVLAIINLVLLIITAAVRPAHSDFSNFELARLGEAGDRKAKKALLREKRISDIYSLQRVFIAFLLVTFTLLIIAALGLGVGIITAIIIAIEYGAISSIGFIQKLSQKIYEKIERPILKFVRKNQIVMKFVRSNPINESKSDAHIDSLSELQYLVSESAGILSPDEKQLIVNSLSFNNQLVRTVMTPRNEISSIEKSEFLGPLVLNDLHQSGYSFLPVVNKDIDHIVGILNLKGMLNLDIKNSSTAAEAMDKKVYYIHENQSLKQALAELISTQQHLLIVVNEDRETVGLVTIEDIIEALMGRKIVDELEGHENLIEVASRRH